MNCSLNCWVRDLKELFEGAFFVPFLSKGLQSSFLYWMVVICKDDQEIKKRLKRDKTRRDIDANGENRGVKTIS